MNHWSFVIYCPPTALIPCSASLHAQEFSDSGSLAAHGGSTGVPQRISTWKCDGSKIRIRLRKKHRHWHLSEEINYSIDVLIWRISYFKVCFYFHLYLVGFYYMRPFKVQNWPISSDTLRKSSWIILIAIYFSKANDLLRKIHYTFL